MSIKKVSTGAAVGANFQSRLDKKNITFLDHVLIDRYKGNIKKQEDPLAAYRQMGFIQIGNEGHDEVVGICPFCNAHKFFFNVSLKVYKCHVCGSGGGYRKFLRECVDTFQDEFNGEIAKKLSVNRSISIETLKHFMVGYNPKTSDYLIPTFDEDNIEVVGMKRFHLFPDGTKTFLNVTGSHQNIFNQHVLTDNINDNSSIVYICEGEWDTMALYEATVKAKGGTGFHTNYYVVGVPGATSMKDAWVNKFKDKNVVVIFDNDKNKRSKNGKITVGAGTQGGLKVYNCISSVVKSIKFVHWKVGTKHKYDVRDLYIDKNRNGKATIREITKLSLDYPKGLDRIKTEQKKSNLMDGGGTTAQEVKQVFNRWLRLRDDSVLDILFGSFIGNRFSFVDPIWLFLVGRSGFCKSELLMSFQKVLDSYVLSTLSENALVSGLVVPEGEQDPSLLPKLNEMILILKDFTNLLTGPEKAMENIMGQFRAIYDGDYSKAFGTTERRYTSLFGFIAGVTHTIEVYVTKNPAYGERFLMYSMDDNLTFNESIEVIMQALSNAGQEPIMRAELQNVVNKCLHFQYSKPTISVETMREIATIAQTLAVLRGATLRDKYRPDEILGTPKAEIGTRIAKVLMKLAQGIAAFNGRKNVTEYELKLLRSVVRSSIPSPNLRLITQIMHAKKDVFTEKELSQFINLTRKANEMIVSNLAFMGILVTTSGDERGLKRVMFSLAKNVKNLIVDGKVLDV